MRCPSCQHENTASQRFCGECGARCGVRILRGFEPAGAEVLRRLRYPVDRAGRAQGCNP